MFFHTGLPTSNLNVRTNDDYCICISWKEKTSFVICMIADNYGIFFLQTCQSFGMNESVCNTTVC
jgi:hypothetical protein